MLAKKKHLSDTEKKFHRKIAVECFNRTWDYLEQENRNHDDDQMMLNLAHASRYHWSLVGKPSNFVIGDWQISRVYSALSQPEMAVDFAKTSLEMCRKNDLSGWLLASAYEGMARAYVSNKDYRFAREYLDRARQQLRSQVVDEEDLKTISDQIDETERMIPK
jgi:tetratricopeptide (TPR) repeat protein